MVKKVILLLAAAVPIAWAIDVGTSISNVSHEGDRQLIGSFRLTLEDDEFKNASELNPIYIRFRLNEARGWAKTLVDLRAGAAESVNRPINLALRPDSNTTLNPAIPETAVQLVRLIKGENAGWIRISNSSSDWVQTDTGTSSPTRFEQVSFGIGLLGTNSVRSGSSTSTGGNEDANTGLLADTLLLADYRDTPNFGNGDLDNLSFISLDSTTLGVENGNAVVSGSDLGIGFSNDGTIARGVNTFPCFEYHFEEDEYNGPGHNIGISRLNLSDFRTYHADVPPVYFSNSSDFDWETTSRLYLTKPGYDPTPLVQGQKLKTLELDMGETCLLPEDVTITTSVAAQWTVNKIYDEDQFVGYEFILEEGVFPVFGWLKVSGLRLQTTDYFVHKPLKLTAHGFYKGEGITLDELGKLGPVTKTTVEMEPTLAPFRKAVPYTGYDETTWDFSVHLTNPNPTPTRFTALFINPSSLLLQILGSQVLPPHGKRSLSIVEFFGDVNKPKLSWIYVVSDQPVAVTGVIGDQDKQELDILNGVGELNHTMFGSHIPQDTVSWETRAYLISSDPDTDASFFLKKPGEEEERIRRLRIPGSTAVLDEDDFVSSSGRTPWFRVDATEAVGSGLLIYRGRNENSQLASVALNAEPSTKWVFGHLGDPENGWWNGVAILNPQAEETEIQLQGFDEEGRVIANRTLVLGAEEKLVDTVSRILNNFGEESFSRLELSADQPIQSFLLIGQPNLMLLTTVPGNLPQSKTLTLPHLLDSDEYWLGLALINPQRRGATLSLTPYGETGEAGEPVTFLIPAGQKQLLQASELFPNTRLSHIVINSDEEISAFALTGNHANTQLATLNLEPILD